MDSRIEVTRHDQQSHPMLEQGWLQPSRAVFRFSQADLSGSRFYRVLQTVLVR